MNEPAKSLGRTSSRLLLTLSEKEKNIFSISDAQKITGSSANATRKLLNDLVNKKWLIRLVPGKYLIVPLSAGEKAEFSENWYIIAKHLMEPAPYYLSYYSALDIHEMITQPLTTVFLSTTKRKKTKQVLDAIYRFIYINPSKIWGIEDVWIKPTETVRVSDLERTIIDCLDNPKFCGGISELAKGLWAKRKNIDYLKLTKYVHRFGSKAVAKRLGFLLELYSIENGTVEELKALVAPSYVLLDPSLPAHGKYLSSWGLRINLDPEELKEIVRT